MQIIFAQNSDYAGLTGERFGGTGVTPPAGGDDNTGGNTGDTPTPPTGDGIYDSNVTWTVGTNAYDSTPDSYGTSQTAVVNGVEVSIFVSLARPRLQVMLL
jgi:hypothetical protein